MGDIIEGGIELTPVAVAAGRRLSERLFNNKPNEHLDYNLVPTVVFSHPPLVRWVLLNRKRLSNMAKKT